MLFATTPVAAGDLADGMAAFNAGDYPKAFRLYKRSAEQGNERAQVNLGMMYQSGEGGPKDYAKAVHWFTEAAKQGDAKGQLMLGLMYGGGTGIPKNYVRAYAWLSLVAEQGSAKAKKATRENFAKRMTPAQIAKGQKLSRELRKKYVVPFQKE